MSESDVTLRNREALRLLLNAAQAISDGELEYAKLLQKQAHRTLSPLWWPRLKVFLTHIAAMDEVLKRR